MKNSIINHGHSGILPALFLLALLLSAGCRSPRQPEIAAYNLDYYFGKSSLTLHGISEMPAPLAADQSGKKQFLTLKERRNLCMEQALFNAHIKWLSLTDQEHKDPSEWKRRLKLGAKDSWSRCLSDSEILHIFYDSMDACRAVVYYPCHPVNY